MATFEEFVQIEMPKRPFVEGDGVPGQIPVRSNNVDHPLELTWADLPGVVVPTTYTAGVNLSGQRVVVLDESRNAIYADNTVASHALTIFGLTKGAALLGEQVEILRNVEVTEPTWNWMSGMPIYLGTNGLMTQTAPTSPALFSLCVGFATATNRMLIQIGSPIFLA